jgi:hypothetical protein
VTGNRMSAQFRGGSAVSRNRSASTRRPAAPPARPARPTPPAPSARRSVEQRSAVFLVYLSRLPRWVPLIGVAAFLVAGLAVRGPIGAAALCVVAAFLAWLGYLSWPRLAAGGRIARVATVLLVLAVAALQATR